MTGASVRTAVVLVSVMSVCGCSFQGSLHASADASSSSRTPASSTTGATTGQPTGSGTSTGALTTATAGSTSGTPSRPDRCSTGDLTASLVPGSPGAGQRYATLVLTNRSGTSCTVHGYGGLGLAGPHGEQLPTRQVRVSAPAPTTVTLQPRGSVSAQLHWAAVPAPGDSQTGNCQPVPTTLRVIPPDETTALSVPWDQGPVCAGGTIEQKAYAG